jgi:hypothetical protein
VFRSPGRFARVRGRAGLDPAGPEGPAALFDQAVAWLREQRVLLPGVSVLARLVAEIRSAAGDRLHEMIAAALVTPARAVG